MLFLSLFFCFIEKNRLKNTKLHRKLFGYSALQRNVPRALFQKSSVYDTVHSDGRILMNEKEYGLKLKITLGDVLFTLFLICLTVYAAIRYVENGKGAYVRITTPKGVYVYPLESNEEYTFDGLHGKTTIRVKGGEVMFLESACPNKTCLSKGGISEAGEFNACLPNGISVHILSRDSKGLMHFSTAGEDVDAVSI